MNYANSEVRLVKSLIFLLLCSFGSANRRTCFTSLYAYPPGSSPNPIDVANDVHYGLFLSCKSAEILCWKNMVSHLGQALGGYGVAYIRGPAAATLCNILKQEILPEDPTHIYSSWTVSSCNEYGNMYLGQICCWRYFVGNVAFYVNNPECTECEKPDCSPNGTITNPSKPSPNQVTGINIATTREPVQFRDPSFLFDFDEAQEEDQETSQDRITQLRSGKLRGLNHLDLNGEEQEEEEVEDEHSMNKRQELLETAHEKRMEGF